MKRIYKNSDIEFKLSDYGFNFDLNMIDAVTFKFFTNKVDIITKNKNDIEDGIIFLDGKDLNLLYEGILYYGYEIETADKRAIDNKLNKIDEIITDYFIKNGNTEDTPKEKDSYYTKLQTDTKLVDKQDKLVSGKNIATINNQDITKGGNITIEGGSGAVKSVNGKKGDVILFGVDIACEYDAINHLKGTIDEGFAFHQTNINGKQDTLMSGTNIKTINNESLLGSTDIQLATKEELNTKADKTELVGKKTTQEGEVFNLESTDYYPNLALGPKSHSEGFATIAYGMGSHSEGWGEENYPETFNGKTLEQRPSANDVLTEWINNFGFSMAYDDASHCEGAETLALGSYSHGEGYSNVSIGSDAHSEGSYNFAYGEDSHGEGYGTISYGWGSHSEGAANDYCNPLNIEGTTIENATTEAITRDWEQKGYNLAYGDGSHTEGNKTLALGANSHCEGIGTIAKNDNEHSEGQYNVSNKDGDDIQSGFRTISSIGVGDWNERKNAVEVLIDTDDNSNSGNAHRCQVFIDGIGGYDGIDAERSYDLAYVINSINNTLNNKSDITFVDKRPNQHSPLMDFLAQNVFYIWGEIEGLTVKKLGSYSGYSEADEFMFQFTSGAKPTLLALPDTIKWINNKPLKIEANKTYIISIVNNIAVGGAI